MIEDILVTCPHCHDDSGYLANDRTVWGQAVLCMRCKNSLIIPNPSEAGFISITPAPQQTPPPVPAGVQFASAVAVIASIVAGGVLIARGIYLLTAF